MNSYTLSAISMLFRVAVGSGLFDTIADLVKYYAGLTDLTGAQKRNFVIERAKTQFAEVSETMIRALLEILVLKLQAK